MKKLFCIVALCFASCSLFAEGADSAVIARHLTAITKTKGFRRSENVALLDATAAYIKTEFLKYSNQVWEQPYTVKGKTYRNVICSFGPRDAKRIIVGAHYDVCGDQQGADDNASGTVGLLEVARLLKDAKLNYRVDLVAYTLEEPPYFETEQMGSFIHAKSLKDSNVAVFGMISLEMIGYFKDEKNSQTYPVGILKARYGSRGNYITLVRKLGHGKFAGKFSRAFKHTHALKTFKFTAPQSLGAIDLSDHLNYWHFHYSAIMITDTSFFRNKNYHEASDTMETLDINRMAKVIDGVAEALVAM